MKKKKECSPAANEARAKQSMKKKKEEAPKYRNWEKDRRDRLNVAFNQLALAISNDSPPVKKIDIVTKACECIELLRQENEQIKKDSGLDQTLLDKETSKYKEQIAELVSRINRLVSYLTELGVDKPQWVSLPPTTPAPPDLGRRPFQYSNKLNVSKVKELLEMPKNKVTKRLQNAKKRALKKKAVVVKKKAVVPKVTSLSQLPPGILLFKSCPPENTPKVVIVPPPAPAAAISTPLILLPPPQQKTQIILSKPPANKVPIRCEVKKTSVKKAKKALMNKNSKAIRHSIEALCKKQLEKETPAKEAQPAQTSQPEPGNANSDRTEAKQSNKATEPDKENIFVPIIRPTTPTAPSKPPSQPTQAQQAQPVNQPVVQPEKIVTHVELPVVSSSSLQANQCQEVSKSSVSASGPQFSMPTLTTAQAKQVFTGNSYPVNSSRSYPDTQTTFSHLNQTPTHFHAPHLAPSQDKAQNKSTPFTHEAPAPLNPVSQADTFSHLKTHLPTFSTFGDISGAHCNQTFTTTASTHQKTPFSSASDIFTHQPQNKSLSFSQGQSFPPKPSNPTFTHEKVHQQQMQKPSTQFDALLQPSQDQRPVYFDLARLPEYNSGDTGFIGPQPPTATVVEHPPKDPGSMYNPFRGDEMSEGVQRPDQNLNSSTYSNDLFASLHVPSGHPESISPTAAFLHTFPLVSAGRNENSERVETGASNLMQLGNLEEGGQQMELNSLIPQMDKQSKRGNKSFSDDLYQMEPDYDAEITSIMSSTPKRQNKQNPFQHQQSKPQQQQQQQQPPPQPNFGYYQQQKRTIAAPQKPVQRETSNRTSEQSNYKSSHNYPFYYQTADQTPPAAPLNLPPVPTTNFMPWNNIEPQQHQSSRSVQQSYSCESRQVNHQSIPAPSQQQQQSQQVQQQQQPQPQQQQQQQQQQQKEVQRPPVNWMTSDVRTDDTAVGILDFEWSRQAQLPTLVGDLALGPTPPTPRKKDNTCKYTSGQNFLSVSQLVDVPKEKAKRRLINSSNKNNSNRRNERNTAKQPASIQQQQQQLQVCPDYHSITNWPAPKPSCKPVPSSYSAESLIGTSQHDQNEKSERYNQRFPRNYLPSEQNSFFPSEQQFDYHQHQYDCSSSYQPNTSFASIVTTSSSTNSIVPSFGQDFIPFSSTPQKSMSNNKRRNDNFYNPDCNRRSIQQYNQQSRTNQQVNASHSAGSSLTNFNMCTLFPEINKPVIAPPLAPFIPSKGQVSDYVLPPPPASFNNLLAPAPPQVFPAPSFPVPSSIQFPTQNEN